MRTCKNCNSDIDQQTVIQAQDGFTEFYECPSCRWWTQQTNGKVVKFELYRHAPFDLTTDDIARTITKVTHSKANGLGWTPIHKDVAVLAQGLVVRYIQSFAETFGIGEREAMTFLVTTGLHPARPTKEFTDVK